MPAGILQFYSGSWSGTDSALAEWLALVGWIWSAFILAQSVTYSPRLLGEKIVVRII